MGRRKILQSCLKVAALHVSEGEELLKKQAELVARLEAEGRDTAAARQLLEQTRALLRQYQSDWVQVGRELREAE
jgi:hypothetical protein